MPSNDLNTFCENLADTLGLTGSEREQALNYPTENLLPLVADLCVKDEQRRGPKFPASCECGASLTGDTFGMRCTECPLAYRPWKGGKVQIGRSAP